MASNTILTNVTTDAAIIGIAGAGFYFEGDASSFVGRNFSKPPFGLLITRSTFSHNSMSSESNSQINMLGGGLAIVSADVGDLIYAQLTDAVFVNNSVRCQFFTVCVGAGIHADLNVMLLANHSVFENNSIVTNQRYGGNGLAAGAAIQARLSVLADSCTFRFNRVEGFTAFGGAISCPSVTVESCLFEKNRVTPARDPPISIGLGGAVHMENGESLVRHISIRFSRFVNNSADFGCDLHCGGGGVALVNPACASPLSTICLPVTHGSVSAAYTLLNNTFEGNDGRAGGAIYISAGHPSAYRSTGNSFIRNTARVGAAVYQDYGASRTYAHDSLDDLCQRYSVAQNNAAVWGSLCSTFPHRIQLVENAPRVIWPGLKFDVSARLLDRYNQTVLYESLPLSVLMWNTVESRNATVSAPNERAVYGFRALRFDSNSSFALLSFFLKVGPVNLAHDLTVPISKCPPAFQERILDSGFAGCEPCDAGYYSLADDAECRQCIEEDEEHHEEEHSEERHCLLSPFSSHADVKPHALQTHAQTGCVCFASYGQPDLSDFFFGTGIGLFLQDSIPPRRQCGPRSYFLA